MADIVVQVGLESLDSYIKQLETMRDEYSTTYTDELYTKVLGEINSAFKGDDSDAFVNKMNDFRNDFDKLYQVLGEYIDHLKEVHKNYKTLVESQTQAAKALLGDA